ncbi:fructokinase [Citrobacter farmeri]|nr:fructokinase [Raoultella planticola]EKX4572313.1 fructokinase [Enterobacter hormaechei]EKZ9443187.1 fructokinase [Enterobacter hormaechei]ELJ2091308.1 fructokinase [Enterobacter hormaechei]MDU2715699.1 fructokinase [Klebsiella michiganensis]
MMIGIDLGGTKTEVIALDDQGVEHFRHRVPTPKNDYAATIQTIVELVLLAESRVGSQGTVGVGIPGTISHHTGKVKNANSVWLNGQPLDRDLSALLKRQVIVANDANCLAISEAADGAGAGYKVVFAVIIGTGCGGGVAVKQGVYVGDNGVAGEWGHNPLPWPDEEELRYLREVPCYCGKTGCNETFISGTGFERTYQRLSGNHLKGSDIMTRLAQGETYAEQAIQYYERRLAKALAALVNILDPGVIVLGGGMSNVDRLYTTLPQLLPQYVFGGECDTPIRKAVHGDSSGVRGAAWLPRLSL